MLIQCYSKTQNIRFLLLLELIIRLVRSQHSIQLVCCLSLLLATSMGLLITSLVPIATCGRVRSIQTALASPGASTSIQATSASATSIVAAVFLFVVFQRIDTSIPTTKRCTETVTEDRQSTPSQNYY